jgi:hypothetical protein
MDDHLVREIAAVLDLSWLHREVAPYYPDRPALDRSGAHDPDAHRRLRIRHPLGGDAAQNQRYAKLTLTSRQVVEACIAAGLVGGEGFAGDARTRDGRCRHRGTAHGGHE